MKPIFIILTFIILSACTVSPPSGWYGQVVREGAAEAQLRRNRAAAYSQVYLGWDQVFRDSVTSIACDRQTAGLYGDWVCRQNGLDGVGQVLFIMKEWQKNRMAGGEVFLFVYQSHAKSHMPVYVAQSTWRGGRYR